METVNISQLGDVYLPGGRARHAGTISCLLPAQDYPFCEAGAVASPQYYLDILKAWAVGKSPVRLIITGTEINASVYIEEVTESEKDGSGDVYTAQVITTPVAITGGQEPVAEDTPVITETNGDDLKTDANTAPDGTSGNGNGAAGGDTAGAGDTANGSGTANDGAAASDGVTGSDAASSADGSTSGGQEKQSGSAALWIVLAVVIVAAAVAVLVLKKKKK